MINRLSIKSLMKNLMLPTMLIGSMSCTPPRLSTDAPTLNICDAAKRAEGSRVRVSGTLVALRRTVEHGSFAEWDIELHTFEMNCNGAGKVVVLGKFESGDEEDKLLYTKLSAEVIVEGTIERIRQERIVYLEDVIVNSIDPWGARHKKRVKQDCSSEPSDTDAIEAVRKDERKRMAINHAQTRKNPKGEGILVNTWVDKYRRGREEWTRNRYFWIVLDRKVYRICPEDDRSIPAAVQKRIGLFHDSKIGSPSMMEQLGINPKETERGTEEANPFPAC